jgi:hypothetical protein
MSNTITLAKCKYCGVYFMPFMSNEGLIQNQDGSIINLFQMDCVAISGCNCGSTNVYKNQWHEGGDVSITKTLLGDRLFHRPGCLTDNLKT